MKLDATVMRHMSKTDFRVLTAVETGMRNHELVPVGLIGSIASLRHGGTNKTLSNLLRDKLVSHDQSCGYDGYRLTNSGYDILALHALKCRGVIVALGDRIGTGKESDVYVAATPDGKQIVLKLHRLGRTSFRNIKKKRDYFMMNQLSKSKKRGGAVYKTLPNSWLFLSRMSALKEYAFMKALFDVGYPTPTPLGHNRHCVAMTLIRGVPLYQIHSNRVSADQAESIFQEAMSLATKLAAHGLVHCDLNEFNLIVDMSGGVQDHVAEDYYVRHSGMSVSTKGALSAHVPVQGHRYDATGEIVSEDPPGPELLLPNGEPKPIVTLIDFPQMVSTRHPNACELFERDIFALKRFFSNKLKCMPQGGWDHLLPQWGDVALHHEEEECLASRAQLRLDHELQASGYSEHDSKRDMELYYYQSDHHYRLPDAADNDQDNDESDHNLHPDSQSNPSDDEQQSSASLEPEQKEEELDESNSEPHDSSSSDDEQQYQIMEEEANQKAKLSVQRHIQDAKKQQNLQYAFRKKNANKTFSKGKRIHKEVSFY